MGMKCPEDQPHLTTYGRNYFAKKKEAVAPHSLNRDWRKRELFRITMENHKLLDRLENLKPTASVKKLEEDYQKNQKYVVNSSWTARRARLYDLVDEGRQCEESRIPRQLRICRILMDPASCRRSIRRDRRRRTA